MAKLQSFKISFGRFPTLCVGCLLMLLFIFVPFNAYAFTLSDSQYPDITDSAPPETATIMDYCQQNDMNLLLFRDNSVGRYYLIGVKDFKIDSSNNVDLWYFNARIYIYYYYYSTGFRDSSKIKSYTCLIGDTQWSDYDFHNKQYFPSVSYSYYWEAPSSWDLLAWYCPVAHTTTTGYAYYGGADNSLTTPSYPLLTFTNNGVARELKYQFGSDGNITIDTIEPEPEYNGLLGQIITWLSQIKQSIIDLPTNISGFFSGLSTNIGTFITNLGDLLIAPFRAADATHQEGIVHKFFFTDIPTFFTNLGDIIAAPFRAGDATHQEGVVHKFFFTDIPTFFSNVVNTILKPFRRGQPYDNYERGSFWLGLDSIGDFFINIGNRIYGFFVPDDDFWEEYNEDWRTSLNYHFGGLIQAEEMILDIIGRPSQQTNNNTRSNSKRPSRSRYSDTDRTYSGSASWNDEKESNRGDTKVERRTLIQIFDFSEGTVDYDFTIPRISIPGNVVSVRPIVLFSGGTYNLYDLMYFGSQHTNNFWDYWYMACNALFFIWGCYHLKAMIDDLIGKNDRKGYFDL